MTATETTGQRRRQELDVDSLNSDLSTIEVTHNSLSEQIKQATGPIFRRVEELCALIASPNDLENAGNSKATDARRDYTSVSPVHNRYDTSSANFSDTLLILFQHGY